MIPKRFEAELNNLIEKFDKEAIDKRIAVYQRYMVSPRPSPLLDS